MQDTLHPDTATLRELAARHGCDPRSIRRALSGAPVRGLAGRRALAAADEWRASLAPREVNSGATHQGSGS